MHNCNAGYGWEGSFAPVSGPGVAPNTAWNFPKTPEYLVAGFAVQAKGRRYVRLDMVRNSGHVEGMLGAEEAKSHRLHCRLTKPANTRKFDQTRGMAWSLEA